MPSTYSASIRLVLQASGENNNTWGNILNTGVFALVDTAIAGWATVALTGPYSLSSALGAADEARAAMLQFTGAGAFTVTVPAVSKSYKVWNACAGILTLSNGSASVTVQPGEVVAVVTDGGASFKRVQPTDFGGASLSNVNRVGGLAAPVAGSDAASKTYVDGAVAAAVYSTGTFGVSITPGDAGKLLTNNGATPSWLAPTVGMLTDYATDQAAKQAATQLAAKNLAIAFAVAL